MNRLQFFAITLFCSFHFVLSGQRTISGHVTDAEDNEPIPNATVFINNTKSGITTDLTGMYQLIIPGEGSYNLRVSHAGYQPVFYDIEPGKESVNFDVSLVSLSLDEVLVVKKIKVSKSDIELFWTSLLGENPSKRTIYAVNTKAPYFYYDSQTKIFKVTCRDFIHVINNITGYYIRVWLDYFIYDHTINTTFWKIDLVFSELEPKNQEQKDLWDENRRKTYNVSRGKFIKSLYNNTMIEDGFLFIRYSLKGVPDRLVIDPVYDLSQFFSDDSLKNYKEFYIRQEIDDLVLACYGRPVIQPNLISPLQITSGVMSNHNQLNAQVFMNWKNVGLYRNRIQTLNGSIRIFPDGTYSNMMKLSPVFGSKPISGINMLLPIEYVPDK